MTLVSDRGAVGTDDGTNRDTAALKGPLPLPLVATTRKNTMVLMTSWYDEAARPEPE